ncbi:integrase catalytic domain-containing protein [Trichonephila clavipes]|nr:integrase catalytic domain-containing protein [Trichonephila clavipes]
MPVAQSPQLDEVHLLWHNQRRPHEEQAGQKVKDEQKVHRPLKSAIKCHATERWTEVLPIILLGLRASLKEDILCTPAELVFGTTIRLPGEMFDSSKPDDDVVNFVSKLKSHMQSLHPKPPKHHGKRPVFIHPGLLEATHVFLLLKRIRSMAYISHSPFLSHISTGNSFTNSSSGANETLEEDLPFPFKSLVLGYSKRIHFNITFRVKLSRKHLLHSGLFTALLHN